jgi:hypothetical protein
MYFYFLFNYTLSNFSQYGKKTLGASLFIIMTICAATLVITLLIFKLNRNSTFSSLGPAGDFYGGLLGTIITFFGLYFIYQTYKQ